MTARKSPSDEGPTNSIVLGVLGLSATGKSTAVQFLAQYLRMPTVYFGGFVLDEVRRRGMPVTPASEELVRDDLRAERGPDALVELALPTIRRQAAANKLVLLDGVYSSTESAHLASQFAHHYVTLAIHAPRHLREARASARSPRSLNPEELRLRDASEIQSMNKGGPIAIADWHIVNDRSPTDFERQLLEIVDQVEASFW